MFTDDKTFSKAHKIIMQRCDYTVVTAVSLIFKIILINLVVYSNAFETQ